MSHYENIRQYSDMTQERLAGMDRHERLMYYHRMYQYIGAALFCFPEMNADNPFDDGLPGEFYVVGAAHDAHMALADLLAGLEWMLNDYYDDAREEATHA